MDKEIKKIHVIGAPIVEAGDHQHSVRFKYYGEFNTIENAKDYIKQNNIKYFWFLDSADSVSK